MPHRPITAKAVATLALLLAGCSARTPLRSFVPSPEPSAERGIRYFMPRDVVHLKVTATYNMGRGWSNDQRATEMCKPGVPVRTLKSVATDISTSTVADRRIAYRLAMEPSSSSAQAFKLGTTNDGLLASVNYSTEDKRFEIAGNVLKSVAGIAGTLLGLDVALVGDFMSVDTAAKPRDRGELCALRANPASMAELIRARDALETALKRTAEARDDGLAAVPRANQDALKLLQSRDDLLARRSVLLESRLATVREAIAITVSMLKNQLGVTAKDSTVGTEAVIDLTQLPTNTSVVGSMGSVSAAREALAAYPEMQRILDSVRIIITLDEAEVLGNAPAAAGASATWKSSACIDGVADDDCVHIFTRSPRPRILRMYVPTGGLPGNSFALKEARLVSLISSDDPIIDVPLSTKALGQHSVALGFARPGTLTSLEQTSTAGLATATSGFAAALSSARDEFSAGLKAVQTSQATIDAIQADARTSQIKELQNQKTLIDAQLALQGATASKDLTAQKQQLDAQIALLGSQQALATAQVSAVASSEVATLRSEIHRLQAQLDLLKLEIELEKLKSQPDNQ